ncbi:MAG: hypothetical protein QM773_21665 [Hyphomonadaceae bacterium]
MKASSLVFAACFAFTCGGAIAQQTPSSKSEPVTVEKPKAPVKPVVPSTKSAATQAKPAGAATKFVSELQGFSPEARAFATAKLSAMTPALRVQAASRVAGKAIALNEIPQTWLATAANPAGAMLWLGGKDVNLVTGPDIEPMFQIAAGERNESGVWVQFNAEAGIRHVLVCDMTGPARWDVVVDSKTRKAMIADADTRGIALVPANATKAYQRVLLVLARPLETGPGSSLMEALRRCEVTPIRG